ncbi:Cob(I)yrinic acid a,c-diamide adenosyltransferase [Raoultella terrigena]|nr:Cob(I)yrinic acid a,c-diamide adenosyltransferase [Raoultella terrigena]
MSEERHRERQQRVKEKVDARIEAAQEERGIVIVFTGNGKGKNHRRFWYRYPRHRARQKGRRDPVH